jgi:hypothetical protein
MTATNDLDRALADWLSEGPARSPATPMAAAVEHARANPRRRDPLAAVRSDPMAARRGSILGLRPVLVLAVVGLLAATIAIGVGGWRLGITPPITSPGPSVPASPSPVPSPTPAPTPITVAIIDALGGEVSATIDDASGLLVGATSEQPSEGGVVPGDQLAISNGGPNRLRLEWTDLPCGAQTGYLVSIDASGSAIAVSREACGGDLLPTDRILVLEFSGPIDAADVAGTVDLPIAGE